MRIIFHISRKQVLKLHRATYVLKNDINCVLGVLLSEKTTFGMIRSVVSAHDNILYINNADGRVVVKELHISILLDLLQTLSFIFAIIHSLTFSIFWSHTTSI